jgi:glyoxylase-like metal-dependent hydrolase (beta-lactamase superfamily II)
MTNLDKRTFMAMTGAGVVLATVPGAFAKQASTSEVFTADDKGTFVGSTIILGEKSAVLIDAQVDRGNATALADRIAAIGRKLETILVTHAHPDHFMGLGILLDRFPEARPIAHPAIQSVLAKIGPAMFDQIKSAMGAGVADRVVIPEALKGNAIRLDGERIDVLDPLHGDTALITPVHVPGLDLLITSDIAFAETHAYVAENTAQEAIEAWRKSLTALESIGAKTIIPGHRLATSKNDASAFAHTRKYLDGWQASLAEAKSADELRAGLLARVGELPVPFFVDRAVKAVFP